MKFFLALFLVANLAFGFGGKREEPAPSTVVVPKSINQISVEIDFKRSPKKQFVLAETGRVVIHENIGIQPDDASVSMPATYQCEYPVSMKLVADDAKAEKEFLPDLHKEMTTLLKSIGVPDDNKNKQFFRSGFFRIQRPNAVALQEGKLSDLEGTYRLESLPELSVIDDKQSIAFVNEHGVGFILPAKKGVGKIKLVVKREPESFENQLCQELDVQGFKVISK